MQTLFYGLRASGKTSIVKNISQKTGIQSRDLDRLVVEEIQKTHSRIHSIGEYVEGPGSMREFRDIEHRVLKKSIDNPAIPVLALGGGTIAFDRNRHSIDPVDNYLLNPHTNQEAKEGTLERVFNRERHPKKSLRVFLDISPEEQIKRLEKDDVGNKDRPDLGQSLQKIYNDRIGNYRNFADITVQVDGKTIDEIVDDILGNTQIQEAIKKAA